MKVAITNQPRPFASGGPKSQGGIVLVFAAVALFALLAMGALALDVGNMILNKGKLQSLVDSAALSAAVTLDLTGDQALAEAEALQMINDNKSTPGYFILSPALTAITPSVTFSLELPFSPTSDTNARYVRVLATGVDLPEILSQIFGIDQSAGASAVAGPGNGEENVCNMAPIMVCGSTASSATGTFGYTPGDVTVLKYSQPDEEVGTGNFHLLRLPGAAGADDVRHELAGGYANCFDPGDTMDTEPGNKAGPVAQGLNTRLGIYTGSPELKNNPKYKPDVIAGKLVSDYVVDKKTGAISSTAPVDGNDFIADYEAKTRACFESKSSADCDYIPPDYGAAHRRIMVVPIGDCTTPVTGTGELPVLGLGCFVLMQAVDQSDAYIVGVFKESCTVNTGDGSGEPKTTGPYKIVLYRDHLSGDS